MKKRNILIFILIFILGICAMALLLPKSSQDDIVIDYDKPITVENMSEETKDEILSRIADYRNKYEDYYGWIFVSGTSVSVPIAQSTDNEFYLRKDFNKIYNMNGTTFADYSNTRYPDEESNLVIYGHNLKNEKQFSTLFNLRREDVITKSKIYLFYKDKLYIYKPFASYITDIDFNYIETRFRGNEFQTLISEILEKSDFSLDASLNKSSKIITLSTCTNRDKDERYVVHGVLMEVVGQ